MDLVIMAVVVGVIGTAVMDIGNILLARSGLISRIDLRVLGRMARGWLGGRFRYADPGEMAQVDNEVMYGVVTHYCIGVGLAIPYLFGWEFLLGGPASPAFAFIYGLATTAASWFLVYPSMGLGALGLQASEGWKPAWSSFTNHLFYGFGLAAGLSLL